MLPFICRFNSPHSNWIFKMTHSTNVIHILTTSNLIPIITFGYVVCLQHAWLLSSYLTVSSDATPFVPHTHTRAHSANANDRQTRLLNHPLSCDHLVFCICIPVSRQSKITWFLFDEYKRIEDKECEKCSFFYDFRSKIYFAIFPGVSRPNMKARV